MMKVINPSLLLTFCLFLPTIGISKSDLVENCEYYKANSFDSRQLLNNALITTQTAPPPASANKIQYWTLPISNLSIVVPVDDYKMVGFFPDEENLKADSILLRGDTYEIHIGGVLQDLDKNNDVNSILDQLKLGAISNLSKLDCSTSSAEQDLKRMRAVSTK